MFGFIENFLEKRRIKKEDEFAQSFGINLGYGTGWGSAYGVNGLMVSEFNYLFEMLLKRQDIMPHDTRIGLQENIPLIAQHSELLLELIDDECNKEVLTEEAGFGISRNLALTNMKNLRGIIVSITNYVNAL